VPALAATDAFKTAESAIPQVAATRDPGAFLSLVSALGQMKSWFEARPTAFYFNPATTPTADQLAAQQATTAARARLPGELKQVAAAFGAGDLYAPPDLVAAYVSGAGDVTRLYVTTSTNPYDTASFDAVRSLRTTVSGQVAVFGSGATSYVGGASAEYADVQSTISSDFLRVAVITIVGILIVWNLVIVAAERGDETELIVRAAQIHALMPMMQFSVAPWRVLSPENLEVVLLAAKLFARPKPL